jgi:hypothetical protein
MVKLTGCVFVDNENAEQGLVVTSEPTEHHLVKARPVRFSATGEVERLHYEVVISQENLRNHFYYLAHRTTLEKTRQFG